MKWINKNYSPPDHTKHCTRFFTRGSRAYGHQWSINDIIVLLYNRNMILMPAFPFPPWPPATLDHQNANPCRPHDLVSLIWLYGLPGFPGHLPGLHRKRSGLGMKPTMRPVASYFSGIDESVPGVQLYLPKSLPSRRIHAVHVFRGWSVGVFIFLLWTAFVISSHHFSAFDVGSLPSGYVYTGPDGSDNNDTCKCNTVTYSLLSACAACQGEGWVR